MDCLHARVQVSDGDTADVVANFIHVGIYARGGGEEVAAWGGGGGHFCVIGRM